MRELLKAYMTAIYKIYGDCKLYQFSDLNVYKGDIEELFNIEKEILSELKARNLSENITENTSKVKGSLNKTMIIAEFLKDPDNGWPRLKHEGII